MKIGAAVRAAWTRYRVQATTMLRGCWRDHRIATIAGSGGALLLLASAVLVPLAAADGSPDAPRPHRHVKQAALAEAPPPTSVAPVVTPTASPSPSASSSAPAAAAPVDRTVISELSDDGIPTVALNAYRVAAARLGATDPSCGIPWWLLAGIGREESDHGRFGGATLHADGISTPPIVGPALDGKGVALIPAPSNGLQLDGDAKYAHALGPMQFIPTTWAGYGVDADGDGHANIFDINDAALGAARYLCAAGGDLTTDAGRQRAVFAYNHSDQYVAQVLALAAAYRDSVKVTGTPKGNTHGSLPGVKHHRNPPPVNPGAPTAAGHSKTARAPARSSAAPRPSSSSRTATRTPTVPVTSTASSAPSTTTSSTHPASTSPKPTSTSPTTHPASTSTSPHPPSTTPKPSPTK